MSTVTVVFCIFRDFFFAMDIVLVNIQWYSINCVCYLKHGETKPAMSKISCLTQKRLFWKVIDRFSNKNTFLGSAQRQLSNSICHVFWAWSDLPTNRGTCWMYWGGFHFEWAVRWQRHTIAFTDLGCDSRYSTFKCEFFFVYPRVGNDQKMSSILWDPRSRDPKWTFSNYLIFL